MYNARNNARSLLAQPMTASDTSLTVEDGSTFPDPPFVISVEDEIIEVSTKNGNALGGLTRGIEGTTPAPHAQAKMVENRFTAGTYHKLKDVLEGLFIEEGTDWEVDEDA